LEEVSPAPLRLGTPAMLLTAGYGFGSSVPVQVTAGRTGPDAALGQLHPLPDIRVPDPPAEPARAADRHRRSGRGATDSAARSDERDRFTLTASAPTRRVALVSCPSLSARSGAGETPTSAPLTRVVLPDVACRVGTAARAQSESDLVVGDAEWSRDPSSRSTVEPQVAPSTWPSDVTLDLTRG
jgi:hypothetical protein